MNVVLQPQIQNGWQGEIELHFARRITKTVLASVTHHGPLRVQRPFYPEDDVCHVYLLHPPGGVVGSDSLNTNIQTEENSHALLTTPGSTKFYRSAGEYAHITQTLNVDKGSVLEWFPQDNIFFPGAKVKIKTRINLQADAKFMGWEINCLGRPAIAENFDSGELDLLLGLYRDNIPLLIERQRVANLQQLEASAGLRGYSINAIFICTYCSEQTIELAREAVTKINPDFPVGITLIDDVLILRALGNSAEKIQKLMITVWQVLRPLLIDKEAFLPRIWST